MSPLSIPRRGRTWRAITLVAVLAAPGCAKRGGGDRDQMLLDSAREGPNVTPVAPKASATPQEEIAHFDSLRNIAQSDIGALHQEQMSGVTYVKAGTSVRPTESGKPQKAGAKR